jgi:hypothetical protein
MPAPTNLNTSTNATMRARAAVLSMLVALSSCSPASNSMLQTLRQAAWRGDGSASARLNPNFRYLRVTIAGRVVLLALGNEDIDLRGPVEVWYSAEREVLRLQNGRLVGAVGLTAEWRNVVLPELPSWSALARGDQAFSWTRVRDVMPGYRFGLRDAMSLRVIAQPKRSELQGMDPQRLTWFEERVESGQVAGLSAVFGNNIDADAVLPPARYAADFRGGQETIVYGEQCLAPDLCFTWQRWPVQAQSAAEQK